MIHGSGRALGGGHGYPLQHSYLENFLDRGAWQAIVHGATKSRAGLSRLLYKNYVCAVSSLHTDEETGAKITQPMKTRALMRRNCKTHLCSQTQAILPLIIQCGSPKNIIWTLLCFSDKLEKKGQ